jgi:tRNA/rRNA methyltransferase
MSILAGLRVVLVRPKFPENVGAAARACLNMDVDRLVLVDPQNYDPAKALPLATAHARHILDSARIVDTLDEAVGDCGLVVATTTRTGGWRTGVSTPAQAATRVREALADSEPVAIVFGPEDRGLTNDEVIPAQVICTIPTARQGTSLNLAQAVLIVLYECFQASRERGFSPTGPSTERRITTREQETLLATVQRALLAIDYLKPDNPDYWMLPLRRFLQRSGLRRFEFNIIMGICRQVLWLAGRSKNDAD